MSPSSELGLKMFGVPNMSKVAEALHEQAPSSREQSSLLSSQLSDVQELLVLGKVEEARRAINRVKYMLGYWSGKEGA